MGLSDTKISAAKEHGINEENAHLLIPEFCDRARVLVLDVMEKMKHEIKPNPNPAAVDIVVARAAMRAYDRAQEELYGTQTH